jgi:hypothetical protein
MVVTHEIGNTILPDPPFRGMTVEGVRLVLTRSLTTGEAVTHLSAVCVGEASSPCLPVADETFLQYHLNWFQMVLFVRWIPALPGQVSSAVYPGKMCPGWRRYLPKVCSR